MSGASLQPEPFKTNYGPFLFVGTGIWVNATHISAVAGTQDPDRCWITTLSTGNDEDASYPVDASTDTVVTALVNTLHDWEMTVGEQRERGRMEVQSEEE